jgi:hypothetical protein
MAFRYERDDARRRIVVTVEGAFQTSAMLAVIERQRADGAWSHGMLYDLRQTTEYPTVAELRALMAEASTRRQAEPPRGPVAILTTDPVMYGIACAYAALGYGKLTIRVFRDFGEADLWLATATIPDA